MKRFLASTAILVALGGCAGAGMELPPVTNAAAMPLPINAAPGNGVSTTLPLIDNLASFYPKQERASAAGVKRPSKGEINGSTWITELDSDVEYVVPVQTSNETGTRQVQQTLITSDLPVGQGSCAHGGFEFIPFGSAAAVAPKPGAPVGAKVTCSVMIGGQIAKLLVEANSNRSLSEVRFKARKRRSTPAFPTGVCSDANYKLSRLVKGGPLSACVVLDATGANTATYFKLPANAGETPLVKIGDGENARLARSTSERLPTGERLVRVQGAQDQLVLQFTNGEYTALTRGK